MGLTKYALLMHQRQQRYDEYIQSGQATPFIYPWDTLPALYLILALYWNYGLSRTRSRSLNIGAYALIVGHSIYIVTHRRCLSLASGYVIGLALMWGVVSAGVLILYNNPSSDFVRLEYRDLKQAPRDPQLEPAKSNGNIQSDKVQHVHRSDSAQTSCGRVQPAQQLVWQVMPHDAIHRIDWIADLMTTFRGPNWNFRIPTMPKIRVPPLPSKSATFSSSLDSTDAECFAISYDSPRSRSFRRSTLWKSAIAYLLIDTVKAIMITDDYFLGLAPLDAPSDWPVIGMIHVTTGLPEALVTRFLRLVISLLGIVNALYLVFSYAPTFFFATLPQLLDPAWVTYSPLTDPRFYSETFSSPFRSIPNKGLAGLWGQTWHQMFRFGFSESAKPLMHILHIRPRSHMGRTVQLFVAFGISGCLHMSASYTSFSVLPSKPLMPMLFFLSQGVGVLLQTGFSDLIVRPLHLEFSKLLRQAANVVFVVSWLYFTGPLLADDFARCGIWLFEPGPVSFVRGFRGQGWWQWGGKIVGVWHGVGQQQTALWNRGIGVF